MLVLSCIQLNIGQNPFANHDVTFLHTPPDTFGAKGEKECKESVKEREERE